MHLMHQMDPLSHSLQLVMGADSQATKVTKDTKRRPMLVIITIFVLFVIFVAA